MQTLTERIELVAKEMDSIVAEAKIDRAMLPVIGRLGMSLFFVEGVVRDLNKPVGKSGVIVPKGGLDLSQPTGDR